MERSNTHKWLIWSIVVLLALNIASLGGLWYSRFNRKPPPPKQQSAPLEDVITRGVGLDAEQEARFRQLHLRHRQVKDSLEGELFRLKAQIQDELFTGTPDTAKMAVLTNRIGDLQAEFEKQLYRHFLDLKALCRPDQYAKLEAVLNDLLDATRHRPPPDPKEQRRPPRDDNREQAPPPPPRHPQ